MTPAADDTANWSGPQPANTAGRWFRLACRQPERRRPGRSVDAERSRMTTEPIRLRPYDAFQTRLAVDLWNQAAGDHFPLREALLRQQVELNLHRRPEDGVAAWRGDTMLGFALLGCYRGDAAPAASLRGRATVTAIAVDPAEQRQGLGTRLVEWLLDRADVPREHVRAGGGVYFLLPGPPRELPATRPFLESLGFAFGREVHDLRADLTVPEAHRIPDAAAQLRRRHLEVGPCRAEETPRLLAFLADEFPGMWWHDADRFFAAGGDPADWLLLRDGPRIIGMARVHYPTARPIGAASFWESLRGPRAGGLGPIGVSAGRRGEGLGNLLLAATLDRLRAKGVDDAVADWTDLLGYYGPFGFKIWKSYVIGR
jgi:GNAT superfamily N-acetyltransferase